MKDNSCQKSTQKRFSIAVCVGIRKHLTDECDGLQTLTTLYSSDNVIKKPEEEDGTPWPQEAGYNVTGRVLIPRHGTQKQDGETLRKKLKGSVDNIP